MRERIKEIICRRVGENPEAVRELIRRTAIRGIRNGHDQAVETLMAGGTDYAIEILARVHEARWIEELEREIEEALPKRWNRRRDRCQLIPPESGK